MKPTIANLVLILMCISCTVADEAKHPINNTLPINSTLDNHNPTSDNVIKEESDSANQTEKSESEDEDVTTMESTVTSDELEDSANRVQKVLNAFYEVTGVLAEVPRQIWMLPIRFGFYPGIKVIKFK